MICDEDPLRHRSRKSTARQKKRWEKCVWMVENWAEWASGHGQLTKIELSVGCKGDTVYLAVGKWCDFHKFGWHLGNVGQYVLTHAIHALARATNPAGAVMTAGTKMELGSVTMGQSGAEGVGR